MYIQLINTLNFLFILNKYVYIYFKIGLVNKKKIIFILFKYFDSYIFNDYKIKLKF